MSAGLTCGLTGLLVCWQSLGEHGACSSWAERVAKRRHVERLMTSLVAEVGPNQANARMVRGIVGDEVDALRRAKGEYASPDAKVARGIAERITARVSRLFDSGVGQY